MPRLHRSHDKTKVIGNYQQEVEAASKIHEPSTGSGVGSTTVVKSVVIARGNGVIYVDASVCSSVQDGLCWRTAFKSLTDALNLARHSLKYSEIRIAGGVYRPEQTYSPIGMDGTHVVGGAFSLPQYNPGIDESGNLINYLDNPTLYNHKMKTFELVSGVNLIGGFRNGHKSDLVTTILDGNLSENSKSPDHVWHVLTAGNDVLGTGIRVNLTNLTILNGDASAAPYFPINYPLNFEEQQVPIYYHDDGGALLVVAQSIINIDNCKFINNKAVAGGAIYFDDGSIVNVNHCTFEKNNGLNGGAIMVRNGGRNTFSDVTRMVSSLIIDNSTFYKNYTPIFGTISSYSNFYDSNQQGIGNGSIILIQNSKFKDLSEGGTIYGDQSNLELIKVIIDNKYVNLKDTYGSLGVYGSTLKNLSVDDCVIKNNNNQLGSGYPGAGIFMEQFQYYPIMPTIYDTRYKIINTLFSKNHNIIEGGAIGTQVYPPEWSNINLILDNNIFKNNKSDIAGGAIFLDNKVSILNSNWCNNTYIDNKAPINPNVQLSLLTITPSKCPSNHTKHHSPC